MLFAFKMRGDEIGIILSQRSFKVQTNKVFNSRSKSFSSADRSIRVLRQIQLELYLGKFMKNFFGGEEKGGYIDPDFYLEKCSSIGEIKEMFEKGSVKIQPTGLIWDLSRGNYHPIYCCFIDSPEWWEKNKSKIRTNWEMELKPGH